MHHRLPLAFVDVETTGLCPTADRIAEIGVVTVDGARVERWTTLLRVARDRPLDSCMDAARDACGDAPPFGEVAADLARRLSGHLFVAHNARFDHAFVRAEFERVGVTFDSPVVCSVMLSRKLYPELAHHDLDSLAAHHGLQVDSRHRALPDADLLWRLWQSIHREHAPATILDALDELLAGPLLPSTLDPSLIERLPERPGAYVLHGEDRVPLAVGAAGNLRLHLLGYFRLDRASNRAVAHAHRITDITWRATRGMLGARLHAAALHDVHLRPSRRLSGADAFTWRLVPNAVPSVVIEPLAEATAAGTDVDAFGVFPTERRARNALARLATTHRLCHGLLGVAASSTRGCAACPVDRPSACVGQARRRLELVRLFAAMRPFRIAPWPYRGPIAIRERTDLHVVDRWQFLGTARSEGDLHAVLEARPGTFDTRLYRLLERALRDTPRHRIVDLCRYRARDARRAPDRAA